MKTNIQKITFVAFVLQQILLLTACGSSGGSSATPVATYPTSGYYNNGGSCYSGSTIVNSSYCSNTTGVYNNGTNGYTVMNGSCYSSSGQIVSSTYCGSTIGVGTTLPIGQGIGGGAYSICTGYYYWGSTLGYCYGSPDNCAGYTLTNATTGQPQYCM